MGSIRFLGYAEKYIAICKGNPSDGRQCHADGRVCRQGIRPDLSRAGGPISRCSRRIGRIRSWRSWCSPTPMCWFSGIGLEVELARLAEKL